jgi:hypothetical protein
MSPQFCDLLLAVSNVALDLGLNRESAILVATSLDLFRSVSQDPDPVTKPWINAGWAPYAEIVASEEAISMARVVIGTLADLSVRAPQTTTVKAIGPQVAFLSINGS